MKLAELVKKILRDEAKDTESVPHSVRVKDEDKIVEFISNPDNTFLISFPRTGSHWLRALMELYFGRPSLVRVFYYPEKTNYLTYHTHDLNLDIEHPIVLYLYRNPVDTIYSQMRFHQESLNDLKLIAYWSELYGRHLSKWLYNETFTTKKTLLSYEKLRENLSLEFTKVTSHFNHVLDTNKLEKINKTVSKEEIKNKTPHDKRVVNLQINYDMQREEFRQKYESQIWELLLDKRHYLKSYF